VPPFLVAASAHRFTLAAQNLKQVSLQNSEARAHTFMADARGLKSVQVYRAKENRNVTKEIPQRINQAWR
jgi:hypothetical protein